MDKWKKYTFDEISLSSLIGLVRNSNEQSPSNEFNYLKMNNITNGGNLDLSVMVKVNATSEEVERYKLLNGDFLFNTRNSIELVGKTAVFSSDDLMLFNNNILRVRFKKHIDSKFINYQFKSSLFKEKLEKIKSGTTNVAAIYYKSLRNVEVFAPLIEEQRRITSKLDELFLKIDKSILLLEENLKHSKALLLSILDEEFSKLDCKQEEIGKILEKSNNLNPITEFKEKEFTYIDITSVNNVQYSIDNPKILKGKDAPSRAKKVVKQGDIVFATTRPNLKNIAIVNKDYINPIASTGFCVLRPIETKLNNEYLFYFLTSQKVQELITPFIKGAQYPAISDKDLLSIKIPLPNSIKEQEKIVSTIKLITDTTNNFINEIQIKLDNMKALKSSLLDQAFKGEL
ncbi:restriction endonuclease subunit S [Sphingobacterium faecium]|uniref:restriction endonuclease subunit S n=1 Tax=Sphingobacterium faecium TaxID=34087 RepID=UPI003DA6A62C